LLLELPLRLQSSLQLELQLLLLELQLFVHRSQHQHFPQTVLPLSNQPVRTLLPELFRFLVPGSASFASRECQRQTHLVSRSERPRFRTPRSQPATAFIPARNFTDLQCLNWLAIPQSNLVLRLREHRFQIVAVGWTELVRVEGPFLPERVPLLRTIRLEA
jgi:hypothetical protein